MTVAPRKVKIRLPANRRARIVSTFLFAATFLLATRMPAAAGDSIKAMTPVSTVGLWIANAGFVSEFQGNQLKHSGRTKSNLSFAGDPRLGNIAGLAFDSGNDLWISFCGGSQFSGEILELTRSSLSDLAHHKPATANVILTNAGASASPLDCPNSLRFDSSGNLWVANSGQFGNQGSVIEFASSQLAQSGNPIPAITITSPDLEGSFRSHELAFDGSGNLWVAAGNVIEFTVQQLAIGGSLAAKVVILASGTFSDASGLVFDAQGNLWVGYSTGGLPTNAGGLEMYSAKQIEGPGTISPEPQVILGPTVAQKSYSLAAPQGMLFDNAGDLWVVNSGTSDHFGTGTVVEFSPSAIASSGNPAPKVVIRPNRKHTNIDFARDLRFGPTLP